jgi:hypothetical protein
LPERMPLGQSKADFFPDFLGKSTRAPLFVHLVSSLYVAIRLVKYIGKLTTGRFAYCTNSGLSLITAVALALLAGLSHCPGPNGIQKD